MAIESSTSVQESGARSSSVGLLERRPDRPPDIARILDHAGAHQRRDIGVELLLVRNSSGTPVRGSSS